MISVDEAYHHIFSSVRAYSTEKVTLLQVLNRTLDKAVFADRDLPPYDRVMMDGIAINNDSLQQGKRQFEIENMSAAGSPLQSLHDKNNYI